MNEALRRTLRDLQTIGATAASMSLEPPHNDPPLLTALRRRQLASRTAQVARALDTAPGERGASGTFNATAAAVLSDWSRRE
jgi:hypothetical protein